MKKNSWQPATDTITTIPWQELFEDLPLARKLAEEIMEDFSWGDNTVFFLDPASLAEDLVNYVQVKMEALDTTDQYYKLLSRLDLCENSGFLIDLEN